MSGTDRWIFYDSNRTVHLRKPDATEFTKAGERPVMCCGAALTGRGLPLNRMRLQDEHHEGNVCDDCLSAYQDLDTAEELPRSVQLGGER